MGSIAAMFNADIRAEERKLGSKWDTRRVNNAKRDVLEMAMRAAERYIGDGDDQADLLAEYDDDSVLYWESAPYGQRQVLRGMAKATAKQRITEAIARYI